MIAPFFQTSSFRSTGQQRSPQQPQFGRQGGFEFQPPAGNRMFERQQISVERLPPERLECRGSLRGQAGRLGLETGAVKRITQQGMAEMGKVYADLMRASGFQPAGEETCDRRDADPTIPFPYLPMGDG